MGNTTSCAPAIITGGVIKVMTSDGKIEVRTRHVKAVELMLENPRQFVCAYGDLKVGHRIPGLAADEELERQELYFLLPIEMLYSVLSQDEMDSLACKVARAMKHGGYHSNIGRIFPVCIFPFEAKMPIDNGSGDAQRPVERFSKQRSWKPALDTIVETPCRL
ncbi:hypothetical protein Syun_022218 [Stephania yunnanensis]|uniref:Uncharacterized protein n=1 Tax=Stephania yunnanensis TaxID=152371 RepID=A0AAP0NSZ3_9MAGN